MACSMIDTSSSNGIAFSFSIPRSSPSSMSISGLLYSALLRGKTLRGHPSRIAETRLLGLPRPHCRGQVVDGPYESEQRADRALAKVEHQPRQFHHVAVGDLRLQRTAAFDATLGAHLAEPLVQTRDVGIRRD